jgi:peptide/nickel transport system permease protein
MTVLGSPLVDDRLRIGHDPLDVAARSPRTMLLRRARSNPSLLIGLGVLSVVVLAAIFAPLVAPHDPLDQDLANRLRDPIWGPNGSWDYILGTDAFGRDFLSRLLYGTRVSLSIGFFAALIAGLVGSTLGLIGGYFGGRIDGFVVYLINVKLALPIILVALSVASLIGGSIPALVLLLGFLSWDRYAVVTRSVTQQLRSSEFVTAARAAGATHLRIVFGEILPNVANHIIVVASLEMALAISVEAVLSFLGLGVRAPTPAWGLMIAEGRNYMFFKPHLIVIPGLALFFLVIAINMLGDGVRDVTAPEVRS